jgi:TonB family protein
MKYFITTLLFLFSLDSFSQSSRDALAGRYTPPIKKEKINELKTIYDLIPNCPGHWNTFLDYVAIEVSSICNGEVKFGISSNAILTHEQKEVIKNAETSADITIKIKFRHKDTLSVIGDYGKNLVMNYRTTVVPQVEAEFPGGYKELDTYLKSIEAGKVSKDRQKALIRFTINENGAIENARISRPSGNNKADEIFLEAINKMPKWKPAKNAEGKTVKQEFIFGSMDEGC